MAGVRQYRPYSPHTSMHDIPQNPITYIHARNVALKKRRLSGHSGFPVLGVLGFISKEAALHTQDCVALQ